MRGLNHVRGDRDVVVDEFRTQRVVGGDAADLGGGQDVAAGIGDASSHDVLLYSSKAAKHKSIYPYLRYGSVVFRLEALGRRLSLSARQCT